MENFRIQFENIDKVTPNDTEIGVTLTIFQKIVSCASPIYVFILKMDFKRVIGYIFKTKPTPYEMFEQI